MIGILDLEMGNLRSVFNAIYTLGFDVDIVKDISQFDQVSHLVIPGVGSYHKAVQHLDGKDLRTPIYKFAEDGKPILGICLGMHLLSEYGDEGGRSQGFGLIPGRVTKLSTNSVFPIPHVGWNSINFKQYHPVFEGIKDGIDCYFVHSYHFVCDKQTDIYATTDYGEVFFSVIGEKNIIGFQFHPEKSQASGLKLIENFCNWDGLC